MASREFFKMRWREWRTVSWSCYNKRVTFLLFNERLRQCNKFSIPASTFSTRSENQSRSDWKARQSQRSGGTKPKVTWWEFISAVLLITKGRRGPFNQRSSRRSCFHLRTRISESWPVRRWLTIALTRPHRKAPSISSSPLVTPPSFQHLLQRSNGTGRGSRRALPEGSYLAPPGRDWLRDNRLLTVRFVSVNLILKSNLGRSEDYVWSCNRFSKRERLIRGINKEYETINCSIISCSKYDNSNLIISIECTLLYNFYKA